MTDFITALQNTGIDPDGQLVEGNVTRATCSCSPHKKNRNGNGWYIYYPDTPAIITWGCWKEDCPNSTGGSYSPKSDRTPSPEELEAIKARMEATRREREEERQKVEVATREKAARLLEKGRDVSASHPYIVNGGITPKGIRQLKEMLLIPMSETGTGTPASLQLIFTDSSKRFLAGTGAIPGPLYHVIKGSEGVLYVVEGWKTGMSVHEATGASVVVAFSSGRLPAVAEVLRKQFPKGEIIIAGDFGNGSCKATEAALKIGGKVVIPIMPEGVTGTDWNDLHRAVGLPEVARQLVTAALPEPNPIPEQGTDAQTMSEELPEPDLWPVLSEDALPGWIGEFISLACDHSEADPAAILTTLLCRFAAEIGSGAFVFVGDAKHRARTNAVIVGSSSKARKGTSAKPVERLFAEIPKGCRTSPGPLSSGEGLISAVKDETKEYDKKTGEYVVTDPGIKDKRLFILDEEFAAALQCTKREGNTLSAIIRGFYDDGNVAPLTKNNKISATGAHVVIVTHITEPELKALLNSIQMTNGFGNRFLWILVRRQKLIALPAPMPDNLVSHYQQIVVQALQLARGAGAISMSNDATRLWIESYRRLTMDREGTAGSIVNRSEAHTIRLSLIYALALGHSQIEESDLIAALAFIDYATKSALRIFGGATADKRKVKILDALQTATDNQMTVTEISNQVFKRHLKSEELNSLLAEMEVGHLITTEKASTTGAPKRLVKLKSLSAKSELSEIRAGSALVNSLNSPNSPNEKEILDRFDALPDFDLDADDLPDFDIDLEPAVSL